MSKLIQIKWYQRAYRHLQLHGIAYVFIAGIVAYICEVYG